MVGVDGLRGCERGIRCAATDDGQDVVKLADTFGERGRKVFVMKVLGGGG